MEVAKADCSRENIEPLAAWLSVLDPTKIEVTWDAKFSDMSLPTASYILNSPVRTGIIETYFTIEFETDRESFDEYNKFKVQYINIVFIGLINCFVHLIDWTSSSLFLAIGRSVGRRYRAG